MSATLHLTVTTVERTVLDIDQVTQVTMPTIQGQITILPGHADLMSVLDIGEVLIKTVDSEKVVPLFIDGGSVQVNQNRVEILTHLGEKAEELDQAQIEEAKRKAEKLLAERPVDVDLAKIEVALQRELAREKMVKKWYQRT